MVEAGGSILAPCPVCHGAVLAPPAVPSIPEALVESKTVYEPTMADTSQCETDLAETFMYHLSNGEGAQLPRCQVDLANTFMYHLGRCEEVQQPEWQFELANTFMRHLSTGEEAYLPECHIDLTGTFMRHLIRLSIRLI